jgi:hypothetical protein
MDVEREDILNLENRFLIQEATNGGMFAHCSMDCIKLCNIVSLIQYDGAQKHVYHSHVCSPTVILNRASPKWNERDNAV